MDDKENELREYVEKFGIAFEKTGGTPIAGRLLGFLIIAEPPYKTFDEIVNYLQASKSAVSNAIKFLNSIHIVDYKTFAGDRKRYFFISWESWNKLIDIDMEGHTKMRYLIKEILPKRSNNYPEFNNGLAALGLFFDILDEEYPKLVEKWRVTVKEKFGLNL